MTLPISQIGPNIQIIIDPFAITEPGMRYERVEPNHATDEMQTCFDDATRRLEEYCAEE